MAALVASPTNLLDGAAERARRNQECQLCFTSLAGKPVANFFDVNDHLVCHHLCHHECLHNADDISRCPDCSRKFHGFKTVPSILDAALWFRYMDTDKDDFISYEEMIEGLKGQLDVDWAGIEAHVDTLWPRWDTNRDGKISFEEFCDPETGVITYLQKNYPRNPRPPAPDLLKGRKKAWFRYWDEDDSRTLDKSEIVRALIKTFQIYEIKKAIIQEIVEKVWPIFDIDNSGVIEYGEFIEEDNFGDAIAAELLHAQGLLADYTEEDLVEEEESDEEEDGENDEIFHEVGEEPEK